jgi:RNA polymerase sigma factor (sigma-70 family)
MDENDRLATQFEAHRARLRGVAHRMLGSTAEADDAVQEAWVRLSRSGAEDVENLGAWLTTVVSRVCLNMLRSRQTRREDPWDDAGAGEPAGVAEPEDDAVLADSVGLALLVVLDTLNPAERLAFVLHDMFGLPFDEIAPMVDKTPEATRQLASRARRRIQHQPVPDRGVEAQRSVVDAFLEAARGGDIEALVAVLHPDALLRADRGSGRLRVVRGAEAVARGASTFQRVAGAGVRAEPALVNGAVGIVASQDGAPLAVMGFTIVDGRIAEIDILNDPTRLATLDLAGLA